MSILQIQQNAGNLYSGLLSTGLIISALGYLGYQLRYIPNKIIEVVKNRMIYVVKIYQYDELFYILEKWLYKNHENLYKNVEALIDDCPTIFESSPYMNEEINEKSNSIKKSIKYQQEDSIFIIKYKGKKLVFNKTKEKLEKSGQSIKDIYFSKYLISGWKCKEVIGELLENIKNEYYTDVPKNQIYVYSNSDYGEWYQSNELIVKPLNNIFLNDGIKNNLINDINKFVNEKDFYFRVGIPYKRGYLLYGPPGNGKTTVSLALASMLERDVYSLTLNNLLDDGRLKFAFSHLKKNSILLIEDVDKIFIDRDSNNHKITFSTFLNCLDGAFYKQGVITILTTNHLEKLDEALIRNGRVDIKMEINNPDNITISNYLSNFYEEDIIIEHSPNVSMCTIQEICIKNREDYKQTIKEIEYYGN